MIFYIKIFTLCVFNKSLKKKLCVIEGAAATWLIKQLYKIDRRVQKSFSWKSSKDCSGDTILWIELPEYCIFSYHGNKEILLRVNESTCSPTGISLQLPSNYLQTPWWMPTFHSEEFQRLRRISDNLKLHSLLRMGKSVK